LGEGYYADRTSKQTVEILQRRGKSLDSQVDSLQLMINNLNSFIKVADSEVEVCFTISLITKLKAYNTWLKNGGLVVICMPHLQFRR